MKFSILVLFYIRKTTEQNIMAILKFDFIDLNLPSGIKWANKNVISTKPSDPGFYLDWDTCYENVYDENYESDWQMPTLEQIEELVNYTIYKWTEKDGVNGMEFVSMKDPSKSIFIPAAGSAFDGEVYDYGKIGNIWSSTLQEVNNSNAYQLLFDEEGVYIGFSSRDGRYSVRPVIK